jgi:hypothetical protein
MGDQMESVTDSGRDSSGEQQMYGKDSKAILSRGNSKELTWENSPDLSNKANNTRFSGKKQRGLTMRSDSRGERNFAGAQVRRGKSKAGDNEDKVIQESDSPHELSEEDS